MKIQPVSYAFKGSQVKDKLEYNIPYFYTADLTKEHSKKEARIFKITTGILALSAAVITLFNLKGRNKFPNDIVEIADKTKGLNNINNFKSTVEELKTKVLYPLMCTIKGDKYAKKSKRFKYGLVITDNNAENLKNMINAFTEHARELGIKTVSIAQSLQRKDKNGQIHTKNLKRNTLNKQVFKEIQTAEQYFREKGKYTIINLGDIAKYTDLKVIKSQKSNFEAILENMNGKKFPGVIWVGWTTKTKSIPLFFSNLPILMTRLTN